MFDEIKPITAAEAARAELPDPDFIVGPLQPGDVGILSGGDGTGKSLVAMSLGASVAYQVAACGVVDAPRHGGRVLYIAGEDRRNDHIRRLKRLGEHLRMEHRINTSEDEERLIILPFEGKRKPLMTPAGVTPAGELFAEAVAGFRFVVLDPLRMMHDLQENDGPSMDMLARWFVTIAMRNQQAILLVQHASQGAILDGRSDHHAGRGATDLPAACRAAWTLRGMTPKEAESAGMDEDERRDWRVLVNGKASHAAEDGARWLQRRGGLWVRSSYTPGEVAEISSKRRKRDAA